MSEELTLLMAERAIEWPSSQPQEREV